MKFSGSMRTMGICLILGLSLGTPVVAHHSFGLYDMSKSLEVKGTVAKMEWTNPHCWLFITAPAGDGSPVTYGFEMTSVGEMIRKGWSKSVLKFGDAVTVAYHPVRDGRPAGYMMTVMTADGKYVGRPPEEPAGHQASPQP
jgi:hypothetical protein